MSKRNKSKLSKKVIVLLVVLLVFLVLRKWYVFSKQTNETIPLNNTHKNQLVQNQNKLVSDQKKTIDDLTSKVIAYEQEKKEEELRRQRIKALQNPDIIYEALQSDETLKLSYTTAKGIVSYDDILSKKGGWFGKTTLEIHNKYLYEFRIEFNINDIQVEGFLDSTVIIKIPKLEPKLTNFESDTKNSNTDEKDKWFSKEFTAEETANILYLAKQKSKEELLLQKDELNKKNYEKQVDRFKEQLRQLILKLGYSKVIIEEY